MKGFLLHSLTQTMIQQSNLYLMFQLRVHPWWTFMRSQWRRTRKNKGVGGGGGGGGGAELD